MSLGFLAIAAAGAGIGLSAYSTLEEGKEQAELGKIAQRQYIAEAKATEQAGQYESREKRKEAARAKASQIAQMAAQGGEITGGNITILADTAKNYEADARVIMRNYQLSATQLRNQGMLAAYQGRLARRSSRIRAFADTATGIGTMYLLSKSKTPSAGT